MTDEEQKYVKELEQANMLLAQTLGSCLGFIKSVADCSTYLKFLSIRKVAAQIVNRFNVVSEDRLGKPVNKMDDKDTKDAVDAPAEPGPTTS